MSFKCSCCGETVLNEKMVLVPTLIRKVTYRKFAKKFRSNDTDLIGTSFGWEIVKEIPIAESHSAGYLEGRTEPAYERDNKTIDTVVKKQIRYEDTRNQ